jgi:hypothetical protein
MTRKEAVVLVSRALSMMWGVFALYETTYLPERLVSYAHYAYRYKVIDNDGSFSYLPLLYRLSTGFLFVRIAGYLVLAWIFWKCGPWVEGTLLPAIVGDEQSSHSDEISED